MRKNMTGQRFGRWLVLEFSHMRGKQAYWLCVCDCGTKKPVSGGSLRAGGTFSCSCSRRGKPIAAKHGHTRGRWWGQPRTPEYVSWQAMIARCEYPKAKRYERYGGRGITVCQRWRESFAAFLQDLGPRPEGTTLNRIDNDGNYEPGNCQWVTPEQQAATRSRPTNWKKET